MYGVGCRGLFVGAMGLSLITVALARDDAQALPTRQVPTVDTTECEDAGACPSTAVMRSRPIPVDVDHLRELGRRGEGTIDLDLFPDASFTGIVERVESYSPGSHTLFGSIAGEKDGHFTLAVSGGAAVANIRVPSRDAYYQIRGIGQDEYIAYQIDESAFPPCATGPKHAAPMPAQAASGGGAVRGCDDDGSVIDVLVVYTPLARQAAGGTEAMEALINLAVAESNTAYANSLIGTQLSLAYKSETDYFEYGGYSDHLVRLTDPDDGYMDEVHRLRDEYRADMVVLLVDDRAYCGIAWLMQHLSPEFESHAFSVVSQSCATGDYTFAHELGHNMGCVHDRANSSVSGVYDYSYGYQAPDEAFRTVMAYDCPGYCPRVDNFSNPDVTYLGQPTGVPVGDPEAAHNALTTNNTSLTVANFRRYFDCNENDVCDDEDISTGISEDCNDNGTPDECEFDCNGTGVPDDCDITAGTSEDCNDNQIPDECLSFEIDCNVNSTPDSCDIENGPSRDCNGNGVPDECEGDCNNNELSDFCDVLDGLSPDENDNGYPDECEPPVAFVDQNATGLDNGQSWKDAFTDLQGALAIAALPRSFVEEIWVAAGTYVPSAEQEPGYERSATFQLVSGVGVYGGFAGGETSRDQRDAALNVTVLSGDLNGDDGLNPATYADNARHVVTAIDNSANTVLDGFTITAGNAYDDAGGGMYIMRGSPTLVDLIITKNTTAWGGGGAAIFLYASPTLINCSFIGNAGHAGGGVIISQSDARLINCTFIENRTVG